MIWLHDVKIGELWSSNSGVKEGQNVRLSSISSLATFAWRRHC